MKKLSFALVILLSLSLWAKAQSQGFFLDDWEPKSISITDYVDVSKPTASATAIVNIEAGNEISKVSKYVFGNNANVYMTQMVDQPQLLENIRNLSPNVIRFPGGNISNVFFWDMEPDQYYDDLPADLVDGADGSIDPAGYWTGKNTSGWTCSLDNYYNMLDSTGQTGIITVNYSYARYGLSDDPVAVAAKYAADWVRYDNGRTKYWEIGNENSGPWQAGYRINTETNKDGQPDTINGGLYGQHFVVFANAMKAAAAEIGHEIKIGAQLIQYESINGWNPTEDDWNELYFQAAGNAADFYIVHSYYTPYNQDSPVEVILNTPTSESKNMMDWMRETTLRAGVDIKPIALTEWNIFAVGSMQMVSHINGMHAAMNVGELIKNKYGQASRWDLANGWSDGNDHGMFNQGDEPGNVPQWNPRPDFYHLYYFQKYFGDRALVSQSTGKSDILSYASRFSSGQTAVVLANRGRTDEVVQLTFDDFTPGTRYYWYTIEGGDDSGDFSRKVFINGEGTEYDAGGPANYQTITARSATSEGGLKINAPALSITHVIIDEGSGVTNTPPIAAVSASKTSGEIALSVDFSAEGSSDPDGDSLEYIWDFGDGTSASGLSVAHTYYTAGNYTVTVNVFDGMDIDQASIEVSALATGATCEHATVNTLPMSQDGAGEHCWVVEGTINNVNSWGMWAVIINGEDFTNEYADQLPAKINGKYYIYVNAGESWSHVDIVGESIPGTTYSLTTSVVGQGTISPLGGDYDENTTLTLTATPVEGWEFVEWSGDISGTSNPTSITMDSDKSIAATFVQEPPTHAIDVTVSGKGTVVRNPDQVGYIEGDVVSLSASPAAGNIFNGWTGDISSNDNPLSVTVTKDISLTANFIEENAPTYSLSVLIDGPGTVDGIPSKIDSIPEGTIITLEAIPNAGAKFNGWSGDISGTTNPTTITMDADKEIFASFVEVGIPCTDAADVALSFAQDGAGTYCFKITEDIAYVNSWNMGSVTINYQDFTNTWSSTMPEKIDGAYYVYYEGNYPWSHFEASALKNAGELSKVEVKLYPNPFSETTMIQLQNPELVKSVELLDHTGRLVLVIDQSEITSNIYLGSNLETGLYFLNVRKDNSVKVYTIVKY